MIGFIILISAALPLLNLLGKGKKVQISKEKEIKPLEEDRDLALARRRRLPLINEWIEQVNRSKGRQQIRCWDFIEGESDDIAFIFFNGEKRLKGHLYFKSDKDKPRVSALRYEEDGKVKTLKGYILPSFSKNQLLNTFKKEKSDPFKIAYLNEVMKKVREGGSAIFSVPKYEGISEEDFKALFTKNELSAFKKMLSEDFKVSDGEKESEFRVELKTVSN